MADQGLSDIKGVSEEDQKMIENIETMMGPEPEDMGFIKNAFWGRLRDDLLFPYPQEGDEERERCDALLEELEAYLENEHPRVEIDQEQYIPEWVIDRLFDMGVMGMIIPEEYGGLGLGVTSYNRVLEMIGRYCASTAVMVSAHQSIGCKAIVMFGTEEQKEKYLPLVAREELSAFCLSEPNVGSDAAAQESFSVKTDDGDYILNGEKKWSTSGAMSGLCTVMCKNMVPNPETGELEQQGVNALIVTPDMDGVEVFEKNRAKTGIRGTWQARFRFNDVRVPEENVLHEEGAGLKVALSCLNYGRCTLSAGVTGAAKAARDQGIKWAQTRYQFERPLADFELVKQKIARMSAVTYAMDAMLYMMTGLLDQGENDIMVETAITKVFCSDFGWNVIDEALQVMGGEGYMTEHELERAWRDNRIHGIVEGSNEVMQSFIFAYGGKQLAEKMVSIQEALLWDSDESIGDNLSRILTAATTPAVIKKALPMGAQLFLGLKPRAPEINGIHPALQEQADTLASLVQKHSHYFKLVSKWEREDVVKHQAQQARVADNAIYLFALASSLSKMDDQLRSGEFGPEFERDRAAFEYLFEWFRRKIHRNFGRMRDNADESMRDAAEAARAHSDTLPNDDFYIHEGSPLGRDAGKEHPQEHIPQFEGEGEDPRAVDREPGDTDDLDLDEMVDDMTEPVDRGDGAPEESTAAPNPEDN
ncbi:alkylation response protein AidB-like acyl-CoA dehydrogenase [Salinibacter ruber]|uniref:acyl-CoA dehydrogenase family protein n=1 Tax=Salinibacter ruber TaxID=146919 RepID=UPI002168603C|nr:acyl-CoA dehydrogenase family protein [Salinibacter ruber]MCS3634059.1 alkylation response protein AidB-like acyl-CoA dehydrogenase [Salinibacter ruber]MCS3713549.1 alkylation response protein AidB-like acyl-CoA dehydrogenase [Salinibacter ruber]